MLKTKIAAPFLLTRKNHALEHATIHVLTKKIPGIKLTGHSNPTGFIVIGKVTTEQVLESALEALSKLQKGDSALAIHPGCGTNLAVTGLVPSIFALLSMSGTTSDKQRRGRFSVLFVSILAGFFIGRKLGPIVQKNITTDADLTGLRITEVNQIGQNFFRIKTSF